MRYWPFLRVAFLIMCMPTFQNVSIVVGFHMTFWRWLSLLYPVLPSPNLISPFRFYYFLPTLYTTVFYLFFHKSLSPQQTLTNLLVSVDIVNVTNISEDSKLTHRNGKVMPIFLCLEIYCEECCIEKWLDNWRPTQTNTMNLSPKAVF